MQVWIQGICIVTFGLTLTACQNMYQHATYPTEAALVANSAQNGLSTEISLDYRQAFQNLREAYNYCIAYTRDQDMVFSDNKFEPDFEMGTLFARTGKGAYLYKMSVEGLKNNQTRLTLFLPKEFVGAQARFQQDIQRALGQDVKCNRQHTASKIK